MPKTGSLRQILSPLVVLFMAACSPSTPSATSIPPTATEVKRPDLAVESLAGAWGPSGKACGDEGAQRGLAVVIRNAGNESASAVQVLLVGSPSQTIDSLAADQTAEVWFAYESAQPAEVIVDAENKVEESNENNNKLSQTIRPAADCAGSAPTAAPTSAPAQAAQPTEAPAVSTVNGQNPLRLRYNDQFVTLVNTGQSSIDIEHIGMRSTKGTDGDDFSNAGRTLGLTLKPGECLVIRSARSTDSIPSDWNCTPLLEATLNKNTLFWRADAADDQQFVVEADGQTVSTCDTAGRAVGRMDALTCELQWPILVSN